MRFLKGFDKEIAAKAPLAGAFRDSNMSRDACHPGDAMKPGILFAAALGLLSIAGHARNAGMTSVQITETKKLKYSFVAWPRGATEPVQFVSSLYLEDTVSFVRLDDARIKLSEDSKKRYVGDFDSLRATRYVPRGTPGVIAPPTWYPASVLGGRWGFPRLTGTVTLYSSQPDRGSYVFMDTGAGMEKYAEEAVRAKISRNASAAKLLRQEKIGHAATWGMALGGVALLGAGAVVTTWTDASGAPLLVIGLGLGLFSWVPHIVVEGKYEQAIRAYNRETSR
jgi:hypothetical protein